MITSRELAATTDSASSAPTGITWRALIAGAIAVPLCNFWLIHMNSVSFNALPTTISLFYHVVFVLLVLCLLNLAVKRVAPRVALGPGELCVLYSMMCLGSVPAGLDCTLILSALVGTPARLATPENGWRELFVDAIPDWLVVKDPVAANGFFEGGSSLFRPENLGPWTGPLVWWAAFLFALWMGTLALSCIFRRRWIESERLGFPVVQLPIEMSECSPRFFGERTMWIAFAVAFFIDLMNGLHTINPLFPMIPVSALHPPFNLATQLGDFPWNAVGFLPIGFYPIVVGLGLLLPTELVFSCVVFFFYWKGLRVLSAWLGLAAVPRAPWIEEQSFGGYVGLALFAAWSSRRHLWSALRSVVRPQPDESREPVSYRWAILLFATCFAGLVCFSLAAGMSFGLAVWFFAAYYAISLAIARIRAELGLPVHDLHFAGPGTMALNVVGSRRLGAQNVIVSTLYWGFNRAYRNHPMPHQSEALYAAHRTGSSQRRAFAALTVALLLGCATAMLYYARASYIHGAATAKMRGHIIWRATEAYGPLAQVLEMPTPFDGRALAAICVGVVTILTGMALSTRVLWWPLHPIGFAVSGTWSMQLLWCPMSIAAAAKSLVVRYGGHHMVKRLVPMAFGLILGDLSGGCMWALYGMYKKQSYYQIWE